MTVTIGIRVDFWEQPALGPDGESKGYVCSVVKEDGFTALAVPAVGESLSAVSLLVGPMNEKPYIAPPQGGYPFHIVRVVEHYPRPLGDDRGPGAIVVVHAQVGYEGERLEEFVRVYAEAGWHWMPGESRAVSRAAEAARTAG
ncbi:hypothetical protein ABTZ03_30755 [Kitasatospora sp. NPDC096077]|uniref:hypothetical protein n=1 Tax=Kitasatospora sp. NPDC096077 TaxID=3155544 RepID=UPI00332FF268